MTTKLNTAVCALALVATLGLAGPAFAQDQSAPVASKTVRYSDLNLSTTEGLRALYGRIQDAAVRVCWDVAPAAILTMKCRANLIEAAVAEVNKPALTSLHTGKPLVERTAQR
jgi:UrcA family protein